MVAIKSHQADSFVKDPQKTIFAYLIYGTDEGRISENAALIARNWSEKFGDGGEILHLDDRALADNPDLLSLEMRSTPMFGGCNVIRISLGPRVKPALVKELVDLQPQNLLIIEAGNLKPSSPVRKLFETSKHAAALACFPDENRDIARLIEEELTAKNISVSPEAQKLLISSLGSDRGVSRQELIKLALYAKDKQQIDPEDIEAIIGDSSQLAYDQLISLILSGNGSKALDKLDRLLASGQSSAGLTTMLGRHLLRLYKVRTLMDAGQNAASALSSLRPPVHFKQKDIMQAEASRLPLKTLQKAIHIVQETVSRARQQSHMELTGTERMIIILSQLASRR